MKNKTSVVNYEVNIKKDGAGSGHIKMAFLTDLHNVSWDNDRDRLPSVIRSLSPDIILCGGDMIVAHPKEGVDKALYFMEQVKDIAPVYYALGNHEYRSRIYPETYGTMYDDYMNPLLKMGVIVLDNDDIDVSVNGVDLKIYGLSIPRENYKRLKKVPLSVKTVTKLIGKRADNKATILLAHNPLFAKTYLSWGADITLCGHNHGGVVRLPKGRGLISPGLKPVSPNCFGRIDRKDKTLIIGAGLGEHTIPLRIHNPRELVMIDLNVNL